MDSQFKKLLNTEHPIIMAPMFLVSNVAMVSEALRCGITAAIPALNFRTDKELRHAIDKLKKCQRPFGINLIVNKSNVKYRSQLEICLEKKVDFIITSLGNPKECIERCKPLGIKVFCDVVDLKYAIKVANLGADAVLAVNNNAGGHSGNLSSKQLIQSIKSRLNIPIISAGGIASFDHVKHHLSLGATAVSVGTVFIASHEATVTNEYKEALMKYGAKDIVKTTKMSGSALTVINTPYVKSIGTQANWLERLMHKNRWLKKYIKMIIAIKGLRIVKNAANRATYKTVWVAGPVIEHIKSIRPVREIIADLIADMNRQ